MLGIGDRLAHCIPFSLAPPPPRFDWSWCGWRTGSPRLLQEPQELCPLASSRLARNSEWPPEQRAATEVRGGAIRSPSREETTCTQIMELIILAPVRGGHGGRQWCVGCMCHRRQRKTLTYNYKYFRNNVGSKQEAWTTFHRPSPGRGAQHMYSYCNTVIV